MEPNETNVQPASDEQSNSDGGTEGAATQAATTEAPKSFTQEDVDRIVKARLAEHSKTAKSKHEKDLEAQIAAAREEASKDLEKTVEERVNARLAQQELTKTRTSLSAEYGLSEEQANRLQGDTPEALAKDAEKIYGALKQLPKPPIIRTGEGTAGPQSPTDLSKMTPAEIRKNADRLWPVRK
jgi:hypothetical protein